MMRFANTLSHNIAKAVCDTATSIRDQIQAAAMASPLAPVVARVEKFLHENDTLIFWGGACFFAVTHLPLFLCGAMVGFTAAYLIDTPDPAWGDVNMTALRQLFRSIILVCSTQIETLGKVLLTGISPGFHSYRVLSGREYGKNIRGFTALEYELSLLCWQLAHWIPLLDVKHHPELHPANCLMRT
jgi:hypothetical protein